ncbi:hypothetical protein IEQ34_012599 [Dendrobium chrysotoxum]|uniref:Uncharacterized protein n=1 Tax=Dendrobium chrysotoxum TaxID=161865 RepID=A0AAV7GNN5_DENCH|nr:hypothetical protein IEQ34_012599 [Dendrobium chrysotoxum]
MAFLVVRQFTTMVQCVLTATEDLVSMQMMKYATSLSRESTVDIEGEATERLEAFYRTLKELALVVSLDERHFLSHILAFFSIVGEIVIKNLASRVWTKVGSLDVKLADRTILIQVAPMMRAVEKKMAFLVVRLFTATVQYVLTATEDLVSAQMMKYATSLSRESIVDIEGEATERLEALYPTLKELALVGSPGSYH